MGGTFTNYSGTRHETAKPERHDRSGEAGQAGSEKSGLDHALAKLAILSDETYV